MDHPCHRLKVAGKGLKRARYRVRSPVHEKRRGMGSYLEGGPPPPYHDPRALAWQRAPRGRIGGEGPVISPAKTGLYTFPSLR